MALGISDPRLTQSQARKKILTTLAEPPTNPSDSLQGFHDALREIAGDWPLLPVEAPGAARRELVFSQPQPAMHPVLWHAGQWLLRREARSPAGSAWANYHAAWLQCLLHPDDARHLPLVTLIVEARGPIPTLVRQAIEAALAQTYAPLEVLMITAAELADESPWWRSWEAVTVVCLPPKRPPAQGCAATEARPDDLWQVAARRSRGLILGRVPLCSPEGLPEPLLLEQGIRAWLHRPQAQWLELEGLRLWPRPLLAELVLEGEPATAAAHQPHGALLAEAALAETKHEVRSEARRLDGPGKGQQRRQDSAETSIPRPHWSGVVNRSTTTDRL